MRQLVDNIMVLSSKVGLQPNNKGRLDSYASFVHEYQRVAQELVKHLWCELGLKDNSENKIPKYLDHKDVARYGITTWLGSRVLQNVGKQVLAVLKGEFTKIKKLSYALKLNQKQGRSKVVSKIQKRINEMSLSCPYCSKLEPQLNANCFKNIRLDRENTQICWLTLSSLKAKGSEEGFASIDVCFKLHKHFNSLRDKSKRLMNSIRLGDNYIAFSFEIEGEPLPEDAKNTPLGVDIGIKDAFSVSNGTKESALNHPHGWTYEKILNKLTRQKKGSKNFKQTQALRLNYLRWAVKRLGLEQSAEIIREDIKDLGRGQRSSRRMKHFNHRIIFDVLDFYCQRHGVHVKAVNQRYTSQRCSSCGYVHHLSRKGKMFKCRACGFTADADLNASFNLALDLPPLSGEGCKPKASRTRILLAYGSKEFIVPWHEEKDMNEIKRHSFINYESYLRKSVEEWASFFSDAVLRLKNDGRTGGDVMVITTWFFDHFKTFFSVSEVVRDHIVSGLLKEFEDYKAGDALDILVEDFSIKLIEGVFAPSKDYSPSTLIELVCFIIYNAEYQFEWGPGDRCLCLQKVDNETYRLRVEIHRYDFCKDETVVEIPAVFELKR